MKRLIPILLASVFFLSSFLFKSCVTASQDLDAKKLYRKDMVLESGGIRYKGGVYVFNREPFYDIKAFLYRKASVVKVLSCHREWVYEKPGKVVEFRYDPVIGIEDEGLCPLEIGAFDLEGQHSWAYIDFVGENEKMVANIDCNGFLGANHGVSVCQSRIGLLQRIRFNMPVKSYASKDCNEFETKDNRSFTVEVTKGKCVYLFTSTAKGEVHRTTTLGYEDVILRE